MLPKADSQELRGNPQFQFLMNLPHFQSLHDCILHLQLALAGLLQTEIFSVGGIPLQLPARFEAAQHQRIQLIAGKNLIGRWAAKLPPKSSHSSSSGLNMSLHVRIKGVAPMRHPRSCACQITLRALCACCQDHFQHAMWMIKAATTHWSTRSI
jgi:hypothetical protein